MKQNMTERQVFMEFMNSMINQWAQVEVTHAGHQERNQSKYTPSVASKIHRQNQILIIEKKKMV